VKKRNSREVSYPVREDAFSMEALDAAAGMIASAPALCVFLQGYWLSGEPRKGKGVDLTFFGSIPGTTAMVRQRKDGLNVAILFNGRRDRRFQQDNDSLKESVDQALDKIGKID
jgi:hypothetical protein